VVLVQLRPSPAGTLRLGGFRGRKPRNSCPRGLNAGGNGFGGNGFTLLVDFKSERLPPFGKVDSGVGMGG